MWADGGCAPANILSLGRVKFSRESFTDCGQSALDTALLKRYRIDATHAWHIFQIDLVIDQQTGRRYYTANVRIEAEDKAKLPANIRLLPGMPVEAFVTTGERSVLDYLVHPFVAELQLGSIDRHEAVCAA